MGRFHYLRIQRNAGQSFRLKIGGVEVWVKRHGHRHLVIAAPEEVNIQREELLPEGERWPGPKGEPNHMGGGI
jgi:hypothetical protein